MKIERGVMVVKNGKAWGKVCSDGHSTQYGWMPIEDATIHNAKYCKIPADVTYKESHYIKELLNSEIKNVIRTTIVKIEK